MKIGILTFHIAYNYGAVLQCYALQETLRRMGHDVYVIDYRQPFISRYFRPKCNLGIRTIIRKILRGELKEYIDTEIRPYKISYKFRHFQQKFLRLSKKCYDVDDIPPFDLYIIGSDQPWNPFLTGGVDEVYFGEFKRPSGSKLVTYAMSTNENELDKIGRDVLKQYLDNFDALAFREQSIADYFSALTRRKCAMTIDPTLLADIDVWNPMINKKWKDEDYVLLYHVGGPTNVIESMTTSAQRLAKKNNCQFIDASKYDYSPEDFVSLIRYAKYVVTASFHATVFSIIFHRPCYVVKTGQASDVRFANILNLLGLQQLLVSPDFREMHCEYTSQEVCIRLLELRRRSLQYIFSFI